MIILSTCIIAPAKAHGGGGGERGGHEGGHGSGEHDREETENRGFSEITGPDSDINMYDDQEIDERRVRRRKGQ